MDHVFLLSGEEGLRHVSSWDLNADSTRPTNVILAIVWHRFEAEPKPQEMKSQA